MLVYQRVQTMFFFPQCWFTGASGVSNWQSSDGILIGTLFMKFFFKSRFIIILPSEIAMAGKSHPLTLYTLWIPLVICACYFYPGNLLNYRVVYLREVLRKYFFFFRSLAPTSASPFIDMGV